jgi:hypothetical protein
MTRTTTTAFVALAMLAAACGGTAAAGSETNSDADPSAGMCLEGVPDCVDADLDGDQNITPVEGGQVDEAAAIRDAEGLLGQTEDEVLELWADVRVGRRGGEHLMLTEDYVIGRKTIATEDDGTGTFRVVEVTIELTDGPLVVTAD